MLLLSGAFAPKLRETVEMHAKWAEVMHLVLQGERAIKEFTKQGEGQQDAMKVSRAKPRGRVGMGMGSPGFGPPMSMGPRGGGFAGRPGGFQVSFSSLQHLLSTRMPAVATQSRNFAPVAV